MFHIILPCHHCIFAAALTFRDRNLGLVGGGGGGGGGRDGGLTSISFREEAILLVPLLAPTHLVAPCNNESCI